MDDATRLNDNGKMINDNGRMTDDSMVYDLLGRRVKGNALRPGLYIRNGKKVFINPLNQ